MTPTPNRPQPVTAAAAGAHLPAAQLPTPPPVGAGGVPARRWQPARSRRYPRQATATLPPSHLAVGQAAIAHPPKRSSRQAGRCCRQYRATAICRCRIRRASQHVLEATTRPGQATAPAAAEGPTGRPEPANPSSCGAVADAATDREGGRWLEAILCDVGGVLLHFDPAAARRIERTHGLPEGTLDRVMRTSPTARQAAVGQINHTDWLRHLRQMVPAKAIDDWHAYHGELDAQVVELLRGARQAGVRIHLLSNAGRRLWDDLAYHGISMVANQVFCGADTRLAKPDPQLFTYVAETAPLRLSRTLYVEAAAAWVEDARRCGLRGHVYTGASGLRQELLQAGVAI